MARFQTVTPSTRFTYGPFLGRGPRGGTGSARAGVRKARDVVARWMPKPPAPPRAPGVRGVRGIGQTQVIDWDEEVVYSGPRSAPKKKSSRKKKRPGKAVKCKNVTMKNGKKRRMCWDKNGLLTKSSKKTSRKKRGRKGRAG